MDLLIQILGVIVWSVFLFTYGCWLVTGIWVVSDHFKRKNIAVHNPRQNS